MEFSTSLTPLFPTMSHLGLLFCIALLHSPPSTSSSLALPTQNRPLRVECDALQRANPKHRTLTSHCCSPFDVIPCPCWSVLLFRDTHGLCRNRRPSRTQETTRKNIRKRQRIIRKRQRIVRKRQVVIRNSRATLLSKRQIARKASAVGTGGGAAGGVAPHIASRPVDAGKGSGGISCRRRVAGRGGRADGLHADDSRVSRLTRFTSHAGGTFFVV